MKHAAFLLLATAVVTLARPASAASTETAGVALGFGSVILDDIADPEFRGDEVKFSIVAHAGEASPGQFHVVHDHRGTIVELRGGLDCVSFAPDAATLSGVVTSGDDHLGERLAIGIRDHGPRDALIFGFQPASTPDPCGWTVPAFGELLPVERGGFSIRTVAA